MPADADLAIASQPPPRYPEHVATVLEQAIIDGRLEAGQRVTDAELSALLGVSRTPVREATRILEARGLIVRKPNGGRYVASRTTEPEAEALYQLRVPLEAYLTGCAAEHMEDAVTKELREVQERFRGALQLGGDADRPEDVNRELIRIDSEFHWVIYDAAGSDLVSIVGSYWGRLLRELSARTYGSQPPADFADQHDAIIAALSNGDVAESTQLMREHIEASWRAVSASYAVDHGEPVDDGAPAN